MIKKWQKNSTKFSNHKIGKKKEKKTLVQRYIYVCTLNKVWKNNIILKGDIICKLKLIITTSSRGANSCIGLKVGMALW